MYLGIVLVVRGSWCAANCAEWNFFKLESLKLGCLPVACVLGSDRVSLKTDRVAI